MVDLECSLSVSVSSVSLTHTISLACLSPSVSDSLPAMNLLCFNEHTHIYFNAMGGAVAQSVERATPGEEVPGSIPAVAARSLLVGSVSV